MSTISTDDISGQDNTYQVAGISLGIRDWAVLEISTSFLIRMGQLTVNDLAEDLGPRMPLSETVDGRLYSFETKF